MKAIINSKIIIEDEVLEDSVIIYDDKIVDIVENNEFENIKILKMIINGDTS